MVSILQIEMKNKGSKNIIDHSEINKTNNSTIEPIGFIQSDIYKENFTFGLQLADTILSMNNFLVSFLIILFLYNDDYEDVSDSMDECREDQVEILQDFLIFWLIFVALSIIEMIIHLIHSAIYVSLMASILYSMGTGNYPKGVYTELETVAKLSFFAKRWR